MLIMADHAMLPGKGIADSRFHPPWAPKIFLLLAGNVGIRTAANR
jgi:hypothetical protein